MNDATMTKADLVERMAKAAKITKKAAETALDSFTAGVRDSLKKGKRVSLVGFGTFTVSKRKARVGRNPATGEQINIPAKRVVKFRVAKAAKDAILGAR